MRQKHFPCLYDLPLKKMREHTHAVHTHAQQYLTESVFARNLYIFIYPVIAAYLHSIPTTQHQYRVWRTFFGYAALFLIFSFFFAFGYLSSFHWIFLYSFTYLIPLERASERYHLILTTQLSPGWAGSDVRLGSKSRHWPSAVSSNGLQQQQQVQRTLIESVAWVCLWEEFVPSWSAECPCGVGENDTEVRSCVLVCDALCVPTS